MQNLRSRRPFAEFRITMKHLKFFAISVAAVAHPIATFAQSVGLSDQSDSKIWTSSNTIAEDINYQPYTNPGGLNPTVSHSYNSGSQGYNTALASIQYSDLIHFGSIAINIDCDAVSGTNTDAGTGGPSQAISAGVSSDYQTNPEYVGAMEDTFTAQSNMVLDFEMLSGFSRQTIQSAQGSNMALVGSVLEGSIDGVQGSDRSTNTILRSTGQSDCFLSFSLTAGQTLDLSMIADTEAFAGTNDPQYQQEDRETTSVSDQLYVFSPTGGQYISGSGTVYAVPEPAAWLPLMLGIGVLALKTRR